VIDVDGAEGLKLTLDSELDAVVLDIGLPEGATPDCAD
jgi:DNA-binding response OmpR family regulator